MSSPSPMVPSTDWHREAQAFGHAQGRQTILCARCVLDLGITTPPTAVVVYEGQSTCLDHLPRPS